MNNPSIKYRGAFYPPLGAVIGWLIGDFFFGHKDPKISIAIGGIVFLYLKFKVINDKLEQLNNKIERQAS